MKKGKKIGLFAVILIIAAAAAVLGAGAYFVRSIQNTNGFLHGTYLNGMNVSGKTPEEAADMLSEGFKDRQVVVLEDGKEVLRLPLTDLGYRVNRQKLVKVLTEFMESEKSDSDSIFQGLKNGSSFDVDLSYKVDKDMFADAIKVEALSEPRRENVNARLTYHEKEKECVIEPEVQGTELKDEDLQAWLRGEIDTSLIGKKASSAEEAADAAGTKDNEGSGNEADATEEGEDEIEIVREIPASLYIPPEKTRDNKRLKEKQKVYNRYTKEVITYDFGGGVTETLEFQDFMDWLKVKDGEATVKQDEVAKYVRGLAEKYETRYRDRVFTTTYGNTVTFPAGLNEYGYTILEDQEAIQLTQDILSGESVTREPVYQTVGAWGDPLYLYRNGLDDMAGTYVEVSISAQHLWYYINGALFIESDVVTGDITLDQGTATGVFPLAFKESPSTLRGGEGKKKYVTKVQYWMPFYEGQGLHDAWWKSVFGGQEYIGNGSHGCVNLPPSVAEAIYNNIVPGTAIVIYN